MRVSAIVPAYNAGRWLERSVTSLVQTRYPDLEIVIVDDGSSDDTLDVALRIQARFSDVVTVLEQPDRARRGASAARNLGIRESSGDAICFLDADDYVYAHRLEAAIPLLESDPSVDGVYELARVVFEGEGARAQWLPDVELFGFHERIDARDLLAALLTGRSWHTSAIVCRRSLLHRTGLFHEKLRIAEDCHLWFRMASVGRLGPGDMSRPVSAYCRHESNTYRADPERKVDMVLAMADAWRWSRREGIPDRVKQTFARGVREYVTNAVVVAREAGRPDVAWRVVRRALSKGCFELLAHRRVLGQIAALARETVHARAMSRAASLHH